MTDWRLPENRREAFQRFYSFHLRYKSHPGCVYSLLPGIAEAYGLDDDQRAWLVWLNGNTQNVVTSLLLLEAAPTPDRWKDAVDFWNEHFTELEWDTDRRHQKSKFGQATEDWYFRHAFAEGWNEATVDWDSTWNVASNQPYMGRLSAWSMIEYARILLPGVPDADTWLLGDLSGSRSHRNGIAVVLGYEAAHWEAEIPSMLGIVQVLERFADELLDEARERNPGHPNVGRLTMESAFCTYKSMHKANRRYPNVYADMMYNRIRRAEKHFGPRFDLLWGIRQQHFPLYLLLEYSPTDPGLCPEKQNHYRITGEIPMMGHDYPDMWSTFDQAVVDGSFGVRR